MNDITFLAGDFLLDSYYDIPKELSWLSKYFKTEIQQQWLRYFLHNGNIDLFVQHTGCFVKKAHLKQLEIRYHKLIAKQNSAKNDFELEKLWEIKTGRCKLNRLN